MPNIVHGGFLLKVYVDCRIFTKSSLKILKTCLYIIVIMEIIIITATT